MRNEKNDHNNCSHGGNSFAFLSGLVVGAALGIIFAPQKGDLTRAKFQKKLKRLTDDIDTGEIKRELGEQLERVNDSPQVQKSKRTIKEKVNSIFEEEPQTARQKIANSLKDSPIIQGLEKKTGKKFIKK